MRLSVRTAKRLKHIRLAFHRSKRGAIGINIFGLILIYKPTKKMMKIDEIIGLTFLTMTAISFLSIATTYASSGM